MGQGGIGSNGSVYWEFVHHLVTGPEVPIDVSGTVGTDNHVGILNGHAIGKDPIAYNDIGSRINLARGFRVTLTYPSATAAGTDLAAATAAVKAAGNTAGSVAVTLTVPAAALRPNRPPLPQMEIQVEW